MDVAPTSHSEEAYDFYKMELTFQQAIDSDYLRNNKTNGSKNLRWVIKPFFAWGVAKKLIF